MRTLLRSVILVLIYTVNLCAFKDFADIQKFVSHHPEYPDNDQVLLTITTPTQVTFNTFLTTLAPRWWESLAQFMGILYRPWSYGNLVTRLQQRTLAESQRMQSGTTHAMSVAQVTSAQPLRYILFGTLAGSIHSLARILEDLIAQKILDTQLVLRAPETRILFLGDIIGASPYNLETLDAVLLLTERNPETTIFLRGWSESNQRWQQFPLMEELAAKLNVTQSQLHTLARTIDALFSALPSAHIITNELGSEALLCAVKEVRESLSYSELTHCAQRIVKATVTPTSCPILAETPSSHPSPFTIHAFLSTTIVGDTYYPMSLVHSAPTAAQPPVWHFISGAPGIYRAMYRVEQEGYCIVDLHANLAESTISLIAHTMESTAPFALTRSYPLTR